MDVQNKYLLFKQKNKIEMKLLFNERMIIIVINLIFCKIYFLKLY